MSRCPYDDLSLEEEMHRLHTRLLASEKRAAEIVRDRGWTEKDDDFEIQVELEAKEQWMLKDDREREEEKLREREEWLDEQMRGRVRDEDIFRRK